MYKQFIGRHLLYLIVFLAICMGIFTACGNKRAIYTSDNTNANANVSNETEKPKPAPISKNAEVLWETEKFKIVRTKVETEPPITEFEGQFYDGLMLVQNEAGQFGYMDTKGELAIPFFEYVFAGNFSEGLAGVGKEDDTDGYRQKNGFINTKGKVVIPFAHQTAFLYSEGLAAVTIDGKCGYMDTKGKIVIPCTYEQAEPFSEGFAAVEVPGYKWGFIDKTGKVVVPFEYCKVGAFHEGMAAVAIEGNPSSSYDLWGFVNTQGELVIPCKYSNLGGSVPDPFREGMVFARDYEKDMDVGYIFDTAGNAILEIDCSVPVSVLWENGLIIIKKTPHGVASYECLDYSGNPLTTPKPGIIQKFPHSNSWGYGNRDSWPIGERVIVQGEDEKSGCADIDGNILIEPKYKRLEFVDSPTGVLTTNVDGFLYFVDETFGEFNTGWTDDKNNKDNAYIATGLDFHNGLSLVQLETQTNDETVAQWYIVEIVQKG